MDGNQHEAAHNQQHHADVARPLYTLVDKKFTFRPEKDATGNTILLPDGSKKKRAPVEAQIKIPTADAIYIALKDDKQCKLIVDTIAEVIFDAAKAQLSDNTNITDGDQLDFNKMTLEYIANLTPSERGSTKIDKEQWEAFFTDFKEVMPTLGYDKQKIEAAGKVLVGKVNAARGKKKVLAALQKYVDLWMTNSKEASNLADVAEFLSNRIQTWLDSDEDELLSEIA